MAALLAKIARSGHHSYTASGASCLELARASCLGLLRGPEEGRGLPAGQVCSVDLLIFLKAFWPLIKGSRISAGWSPTCWRSSLPNLAWRGRRRTSSKEAVHRIAAMAEQLVQAALQASQKASEAVVMMQQQMPQQAATSQQLHNEATLALQALNQKAQRVQEYQEQQAENAENRGGFGSYSDASKVVKMPESLGSENQDADHSKWTEFVVGFKAWLTFAEPQFDAGLRDAEAASDPLGINAMSTEEAARSKRLFSVLSGLLRHRRLVILNSVTDRNGYEVWRLLTSVFAPKMKGPSCSTLASRRTAPCVNRSLHWNALLKNIN